MRIILNRPMRALAILVLTFLCPSCVPAQQASSSGEELSFGYPTVEAALEALRARDDVEISVEQGWTVVVDRSGFTFWSFTPSTHAAHPSGAKRVLTQRGGNWYMTTALLCGATKVECERLLDEYKELDDKMREYTNKVLREQ